uniref:HAT C-terminal dimerisation domain-containing protein n=1 Tax=Chenopodium quinoa TaxID=63459 RepID=A0A803NBN0_CHEQI
MDRDVLAISVSTVESESAFSTCGGVLDVFRSSLSTHMVEALICAQDWMRTTRDLLMIEESIDDTQQIKEELSSLVDPPRFPSSMIIFRIRDITSESAAPTNPSSEDPLASCAAATEPV